MYKFTLNTMHTLYKISVVISQYSNGSLLPKSNVILQYMMHCDFTTDGDAASQKIQNACIVNPKNYFTGFVILLHNI